MATSKENNPYYFIKLYQLLAHTRKMTDHAKAEMLVKNEGGQLLGLALLIEDTQESAQAQAAIEAWWDEQMFHLEARHAEPLPPRIPIAVQMKINLETMELLAILGLRPAPSPRRF